MARKKTPEALLAKVDAYEAASKNTDGDNSNQSDSARTCANPMRQILKKLNHEAHEAARDDRGLVTPEAFQAALQPIKREVADIINEEIRAALSHAPTVRSDADYGQAINAVAKLVPVERLLREQATSIVANLEAQSLEEKVSTLKTLAEKRGLRLVVNE